MMVIDIKLNNKPKISDAQERVKQAKEKKAIANETIGEAFSRIYAMALTDKERELVDVAHEAIAAGEAGRLSDGKMSKGEALTIGANVLRNWEDSQRASRISEVIASKPDNFYILTDDSELPAFLDKVREECKLQRKEFANKFDCLGVKSMTACDYEGTGIDSYIDLSIGFSIWLPILNEGYYLAYGHIDGVIDSEYAFKRGDKQLSRDAVLRTLAPYLSSQTEGKTFHMGSARYDLHIAENDGYSIRGCVWDTLDAMYTMTEHLDSYALKRLTERYAKQLGIEGTIYTFEDMFGRRSPAPYNTEIVGIYAIKDVLYGWRLFDWQFGVMSKTGRLLEVYAKIDSKLAEVDAFMKRCGFVIDLDELKKLDSEFTREIEQAKKNVVESYSINAEFLRTMSKVINGDKINDWIHKQKARIEKRELAISKAKVIISESERLGKTGLKKYEQAVEQLAKLENDKLIPALPENAPDYIHSFEFTNNNHIGYLIYDFLGIEDKTPRIKRGKARSTASDVLQMYYDDEESLKPLATVAEYEKLLNTYVRKIPEAMEIDGRFHSEFKSGGTSTGRYSSSAYSGRPIDIFN